MPAPGKEFISGLDLRDYYQHGIDYPGIRSDTLEILLAER